MTISLFIEGDLDSILRCIDGLVADHALHHLLDFEHCFFRGKDVVLERLKVG